MNLPVYNRTIFYKLLYWSESYANFKQKSVTVMWRKYKVMMVYCLSQLQRWMVMIRSARGWHYTPFPACLYKYQINLDDLLIINIQRNQHHITGSSELTFHRNWLVNVWHIPWCTFFYNPFIFHMCIPCGKTFSLVPRLSSYTRFKVKCEGQITPAPKNDIAQNFSVLSDRAFIFHMCIPFLWCEGQGPI